MEWRVAILILVIGLALNAASSFYLYYYFNKISRTQDVSISIYALKHASYMGISSIIIVIIGILYIINVLPF
jgi:hypothetical protein